MFYTYDGDAGVTFGKWDTTTGQTKTFFAPKRNLGVQDVPAAKSYVARQVVGAKQITPQEASATLKAAKARTAANAATVARAAGGMATWGEAAVGVVGRAGEGLLGLIPCYVLEYGTTIGPDIGFHVYCEPNTY